MKKISLLLLVIVLGSLVLLSLPQPTQAGLVPCGLRQDDPEQKGDQTVPCQLCHFFVLFNNVVNFLLFKIVPPLAVLMLVIGGFMYLFAYFSPGQVLPGGGKGGPALLGQAKKLLTSVVIGIVIMFGAWAIVNAFFQAIGVEEWTGLKTWWEIKGCPKTITAPPSTTPPSSTTPPPSSGPTPTPPPSSATSSAPTTKTCYYSKNDNSYWQDKIDCNNMDVYSSCEATQVPVYFPCLGAPGPTPPPTTATPPPTTATPPPTTITCYCGEDKCYRFKPACDFLNRHSTCLPKQVPVGTLCSSQ